MLEIDKKLLEYTSEHTSPADPVLEELYRETHVKIMNPGMISGPFQGKLLEIISKLIRPHNVLEIGTYTGYSAICLSKGLAHGGLVHTIEHNDEIVPFAKKYFEKSGTSDQIKIYTGEALKIIPALDLIFDLVFIDGEKDEYTEYYDLIFPKLRKGGIILADNVLWYGKVVHEEKESKDTAAIKKFNKMIASDPRVEQVLLPVRDGLMMIRKI